MKKHKLIGFALWSVANIILILHLWEYLIIAPVLAVQVVIWICCSVLFLMDVSSRGIRIGINISAILVGLLAIFYILYFRQPIAWLTLISSTTLPIKDFLCVRKKKTNKLLTKITAISLLVILVLSVGFTVREFALSRHTGLSNGLSATWSIANENFFDELTEDCTTQEEVVMVGYRWITENIEYDYGYDPLYQFFNIEKTLQTEKGICYDFANLFTAYCRSQGIPCFAVDGVCRKDGTSQHTWNRVYFNGSWWNVDVTNDAIATENFYGFHKINSLTETDADYTITRIY